MSDSVSPWTAAHQAPPSLTLSQNLLKFMSIGLMMPSNHLILISSHFISALFSFCLQSFPASGSFPMRQLFTSGGQSIGASASASVLPKNIQDCLTLGLTGLISLQSRGLSGVFYSTTIWKDQFFNAQPYGPTLTSIHDYWKNHSFNYVYGSLSAKQCLCFLICCLGFS